METIQYNNLNLKVEKIFDFLREIVYELNF